MKRALIPVTIICLSFALLAGCSGKPQNADVPTTGALTIPDYNMKIDGRFARFDNGTEMILGPNGSAIILHGDMDLSILNSGDSITIYCYALAESYPEQTNVLECELHERGRLNDLPLDTMETMKEFGYEIKEFDKLNLRDYSTMAMKDFYSYKYKATGDFIILDVRRADEYAEGHIPSAINYANEDIADTPIDVLPDMNQTIYVYCRSGRRSKEAAEKLVKIGYTNIIEIGGILDWPGEIEK